MEHVENEERMALKDAAKMEMALTAREGLSLMSGSSAVIPVNDCSLAGRAGSGDCRESVGAFHSYIGCGDCRASIGVFDSGVGGL
ncbi:MAG: hypothetical protein LUF30_06455, partial [Lachnospiraceae bacterium]|nr:hypothetical protein [Lachnospiraceae bacterium]